MYVTYVGRSACCSRVRRAALGEREEASEGAVVIMDAHQLLQLLLSAYTALEQPLLLAALIGSVGLER